MQPAFLVFRRLLNSTAQTVRSMRMPQRLVVRDAKAINNRRSIQPAKNLSEANSYLSKLSSARKVGIRFSRSNQPLVYA